VKIPAPRGRERIDFDEFDFGLGTDHDVGSRRLFGQRQGTGDGPLKKYLQEQGA
jgi:hypothetical protein